MVSSQYCGTVGKSWKRRYCVLYEDGYLAIHEGENHPETEKKILLQRCCKKISTGIECHKWDSMILPKGVEGLDSMFSIKVKTFTFKKDYIFLADNDHECEHWVRMIEKVLFTSAMMGDCLNVFSEDMHIPARRAISES